MTYENWYLSLPSQMLSVIRLRQGLVGSVSDQENVTEWAGFPVGQHYKVTMSVHCHKSVPMLI